MMTHNGKNKKSPVLICIFEHIVTSRLSQQNNVCSFVVEFIKYYKDNTVWQAENIMFWLHQGDSQSF